MRDRRRRLHSRWSLLVALLITLSTAGPMLTREALPKATPVTQETATQHGINLDDMDLSADLAEDFNRFANGGWLDRTEIPGEEASVNNFQILRQQTADLLLDLLRDLDGDPSLDGGGRRVEGGPGLQSAPGRGGPE